jgi:hypothetical protein
MEQYHEQKSGCKEDDQEGTGQDHEGKKGSQEGQERRKVAPAVSQQQASSKPAVKHTQ